MRDGHHEYVLVLKCPERLGIVAAVANFLAGGDFSILDSNQYMDPASNTFFMRVHFRAEHAGCADAGALRAAFAVTAAGFDMAWQVHDQSRKPRVLIAVSRFGHCLNDLLHRWRTGLLPIEIPAIISNHEDMRSFVEWNGLPYHYLPVSAATRDAQEDRIIGLVDSLDIDLVVLARYMQVLSPRLCEHLRGRCINIHHSFLPGFKGAKPYHQAHARGVKMIGASAHYVTGDLDEGPIIAQDTRHIDHSYTPERMVALGQEVECTVLGRAVGWHVDHRIIDNGVRTVVFSS